MLWHPCITGATPLLGSIATKAHTGDCPEPAGLLVSARLAHLSLVSRGCWLPWPQSRGLEGGLKHNVGPGGQRDGPRIFLRPIPVLDIARGL